MIETTCTTAQKVPITVSPQSSSGAPAPIDGALRLAVLSGDGTVEQDPNDPLVFFVVSGSTVGDSEFSVDADAAPGAEERIIGDRVLLHVTAEEAASLGLTAGAPVAK